MFGNPNMLTSSVVNRIKKVMGVYINKKKGFNFNLKSKPLIYNLNTLWDSVF
jgi:hypothetical protein